MSGVLSEYVVEAVVRIDKARRVQRAKVAKGHIRFAKDGRIVLETPFSDELLYELRALIQGRWDTSAKHWHCAPCLQNVQKCELIARDFGVKLPEDWAATDLTLNAASGQLALTGESDRAPVRICVPQTWINAGAEA